METHTNEKFFIGLSVTISIGFILSNVNAQITVTASSVAPDSSIFIGTNKGLFRSADDGMTWVNIGFPDNEIDALAIHPDGIIFINEGPDGMYLSIDRGANWTSLGVNGKPIAVSPTEILFRVAGYGMVYCSVDNGNTWYPANTGLAQEKLVINEFMAVNESNIADEAGDFDDWLKIFNSGEEKSLPLCMEKNRPGATRWNTTRRI